MFLVGQIDISPLLDLLKRSVMTFHLTCCLCGTTHSIKAVSIASGIYLILHAEMYLIVYGHLILRLTQYSMTACSCYSWQTNFQMVNFIADVFSMKPFLSNDIYF